MGYYEDLRDAVHKQLSILHDQQHKSYDEIFRELDATSKETIRKLTGKEYSSLHPDLQTLEELGDALNIQIPADQYRPKLPAAVQQDMSVLASYMLRFDEFQRTMVLDCCRMLDSSRQHYQKSRPRIAAAADSPAHYGRRKSKAEKGSQGKNDQPPQSSTRKTD